MRLLRCQSLIKRGFSSTPKGRLVEVEWPVDKVAVIKLNNPTEMNALTEEMGDEFTQVIQQLTKDAHDQKLRAVILRGAGASFSAGGNLNWLKERSLTGGYENSNIMLKFYKRFLCIKDLPVPTIAAIHGFSIGAGCCLTLACDMRLVTNNASLGFTFPKLGIHPGMGASLLLRRVVSGDYANYLLLTGQVIKGQAAVTRGLAMDTFETEEAMFSKALEIAQTLAGNSPIAVQSTVQTIRNQKFEGLDSALRREADSQALAYLSGDYVKGIEAVKTKKPAAFQGWEIKK